MIFIDDSFKFNDTNKVAVKKYLNELKKLNVRLYFVHVRSDGKIGMEAIDDFNRSANFFRLEALANLEIQKYKEPIADGIRKDLRGAYFLMINLILTTML